MYGIRVRLEEGPYRGETFSDKGAAIEQCGNVAKGSIVDLDQRPAQFLGLSEGGDVELRGLRVAGKIPIPWREYAQARRGWQRDVARGPGISIAGIVAFDNMQHRHGIVHGIGKNRHAVEALASGHHASSADAANRGFQSDDIVEGGGGTAGARRISAEREGRKAGSDRHRRA